MSIWSKGIGSILGSFGNSVASEIKVEDLSVKDAIVAVMGPTGSGKSSFIEIATGVQGRVGHTLESCTSEISVVKLSFPELLDSDICFVDTPGFDDTNKSDVDIFKMISGWLNDTYKRKIQLTGLLYFHRISDNRMAGTPLKNLRLFERLCGDDFNSIVLTTTMWDDVDEETGAGREKELASVYWKSMIERGSSVKRFLNNRSSAFEILRPIINEVNKNSALLLQKEMMDLRLQLRQTTAGRSLFVELEDLVARHQRALSRIRGGLTDSAFDQEQLKEVMEEYQRVSAQLQRAVEDMQRMKVSTGEWFRKLVIKKNWKRILGFFKGNSRKASTDLMISPNPTPNLPTDLAGADMITSSAASIEYTDNPDLIETPELPHKDSSTMVQNAHVTEETDPGNHANALLTTTSDSNQRPEERKGFSSPARITPVPNRNPTLYSLPEQKDISTLAPIPSVAGVADAGNNAITTISGPIIIDDPDSLHKTYSSATAQIPSSKVDPGEHVDVTLEAIPNPRIVVNPTSGSPDLMIPNLDHKTLAQNCIPFVTESTPKSPLESTFRKVPYLLYGDDKNSSDRVDSDGAASRSDSHNTGGDVDTGTAKTLPARPSVTNVAGNKIAGNDNAGTGSMSTIADFSVVGDRNFETTHPSSSNAGHPIATTDLPSSDSNVLSADMEIGSKVKGSISDKVGGFFNRMVNPHAVDDSSYQDKNENVNRRRRSTAIVGFKTKKNITAKVGHTANKQPIPWTDKV